jgi:F-type H+-transporting ATPase subunit a
VVGGALGILAAINQNGPIDYACTFVAMLGVSLGAVGWIGGVMPLALTVALTALELLVAFLQAYVFAILTCIYLNDAIHPGH